MLLFALDFLRACEVALRIAGPLILAGRHRRLDLLAPLLAHLPIELPDLFLVEAGAPDLLVQLPLGLEHLADRVVDVLPALARLPRPLPLVPRPARIGRAGHIEVRMCESRVALEDARREIRLKRTEGRREHLE